MPTRYLSEPTWNNPTALPFRIIVGPEDRTMSTLEFWLQGRFRVGSRSNRMGLRWKGLPSSSRRSRIGCQHPWRLGPSRLPAASSSSWASLAGPWAVTPTSRT